MSKFTSSNIQSVADDMRDKKSKKTPYHILIGAGCSVTAGIPQASDMIKEILEKKCSLPRLRNFNDTDKKSYGNVMGCLPGDDRKDYINECIRKGGLNWGHIALIQLLKKGYIERILSLNFDQLPEQAASLLGKPITVYDFGVAPFKDTHAIANPAIIHMHGQRDGYVLHNTLPEVNAHKENLEPLLLDSIQHRALLVLGYSGESDGISESIIEHYKGSRMLSWAGYDEEHGQHLDPLFNENDHAHYYGGADFDRFMIQLCQELDVWPPELVNSPMQHLLDELDGIQNYPVGDHDNIDRLGELKSRITNAQDQWEADDKKNLFIEIQSEYDQGHYEVAETLYNALTSQQKEHLSPNEKEAAAWIYIELGNKQYTEGTISIEKCSSSIPFYEKAATIKPDKHEAFHNWGIALSRQATLYAKKTETKDKALTILKLAIEKFEKTTTINPDNHAAFYNCGFTFSTKADLYAEKLETEDEALAAWGSAIEQYEKAIAIKPDKHEAFNNWGSALDEQANLYAKKPETEEKALVTWDSAFKQYEKATTIKPDKHGTFHNWGVSLSHKATLYARKIETEDKALGCWDASFEKYGKATAIKPDKYESFYCWGLALAEQAKLYEKKSDAEDKALAALASASDRYEKASAINPSHKKTFNSWASAKVHEYHLSSSLEEKNGHLNQAEALCQKAQEAGHYNLACVYALKGEVEKIELALKNCLSHNNLPEWQHVESDDDLSIVKNELWFKGFIKELKLAKPSSN